MSSAEKINLKSEEPRIIRRLGTSEYIDLGKTKVEIIKNNLGFSPSGVIVRLIGEKGDVRDEFVSKYIGSDETNGFDEGWQALIDNGFLLPARPEDEV
jgi:hypothetical protein